MNFRQITQIFIIIVLLFTKRLNAQNNDKSQLKLTECIEVEDYKECLYSYIGKALSSNLNNDILTLMVNDSKSKDTINIGFSFTINQFGKIDKKIFRSNFRYKKLIENSIQEILSQNLSFKVPVNKCSQPLISYNGGVQLKYLVSKKKGSISLELLSFKKREEQDLEFFKNDGIAPKHKNCNNLKDNKQLKKCLSKQVSIFVAKKFNVKVIQKLNLSGCLQKIYVGFKVDKTGKIVDVDAIASYPELEKEAIRIVKKFPKVKPGYINGKPVGVLYSLPIVIK